MTRRDETPWYSKHEAQDPSEPPFEDGNVEDLRTVADRLSKSQGTPPPKHVEGPVLKRSELGER